MSSGIKHTTLFIDVTQVLPRQKSYFKVDGYIFGLSSVLYSDLYWTALMHL